MRDAQSLSAIVKVEAASALSGGRYALRELEVGYLRTDIKSLREVGLEAAIFQGVALRIATERQW